MSQCYDCRYFRVGEKKCGYSGYSRSATSECGIAEHKSDNRRCCGNCRYYRVDEKRCAQNGNRHDPWDECGCYEYSRA